MGTPRFKDLTWRGALIAAGLLVCLVGCNTISSIGGPIDPSKGVDHVDPALDLTRQDYRHIAAPKQDEKTPKTEIVKDAPPIPKLEDILAAPRPPKIGETQLVSIAVTDDVPLKDVLLELAKLGDVDIELDATITGGISFIAKNKPFNEVIDRIADLANLRYTMKNGVLRVERDTPYIKSYPIDFLNMDRDSDSAVNLSTNVLSSSVGGGGAAGGASGGGASGGASGGAGGSSGGSSSGLNTGSTSSVKSKTTGDFWKALESGVQQILTYQAPQHLSDTTLQAETDANVVGAAARPQNNGAPGAAASAAAGAATGSGAATGAATGAAAGSAANPAATAGKNYTINRQAGILTLNATGKQHELMEQLLGKLRSNASSQVLIEAKVIEVDLQDEFASGINWATIGTRLGSVLGGGSISESFPLATPANPVAATGSFIQFNTTANPDNIIQLLEAFGSVRTLSSPRLHAINNQQSTMTFAENFVYFTITVTAATTVSTGGIATTPTAPTFSSTTQTVPIGIMMTMMPSIDLENNEVTLAVRPTLSTLIGTVDDPAFELTLAQDAPTQLGKIHNQVPEIQVRELDSTLKLKSGQTMVIGGLMQQEATNNDSGVPFISGIPVVGNFFKNVAKDSHNKELVLLIKATIVDTRGSLNETDKRIFRKFSDDPRPVSF